MISGAADPERARRRWPRSSERLVRRDDKLIQLFDPPFDQGALQPGYIKGYVPGIRENGGQYTHAATWVVLATALQGRGDRALELWNLLNPIYHATTPAEVEHYKVEPYVVCADVYGAPPHTGRGGWTWYTGSASWLYRVALEAILGFRLAGDTLRFEPCVPPSWPGFEIDLPLPVRDVPRPGGEPGRHRPRRPVRHGGRSAGAGRHGAAAGRRANARRPGDAGLTREG